MPVPRRINFGKAPRRHAAPPLGPSREPAYCLKCDHMSAFPCKVPCRKDWQSAAIRAVLTVNPGRPERSEILPRRL